MGNKLLKQTVSFIETRHILQEAGEYLDLLQREEVIPSAAGRRREIEEEIASRGTYRQTFAELEHGARTAWRNSTRCVGRKYWPSLAVRDCRHLEAPEEIFTALVEHLRLSTNGGSIRPMITVFAPEEPGRPGIRIWNEQLIRYAGYRRPDGSILGDPRQEELTRIARRLGWTGDEGTPFDLLPLILQMPDGGLHLFELPRDAVLEVEIVHPDHPWLAGLGLRWHALPAISGMLLDAGGIRYPAAPFSGWYMLTEVAARNFSDESRYNLLPEIAARLGLDTRREESLWRDRALLELNVAVIHSFRQAGVKMIDHHTASRHFVEFEEKERRQGRPAYADWAWIVPPLSGSATPLFHRPYENVELKPNFFYQPVPWQAAAAPTGCPFHQAAAPSPRVMVRRSRSA
ncbi:MAG: nitric oxide synthase oxygenase [Thermoanaerobaculia bacterium]